MLVQINMNTRFLKPMQLPEPEAATSDAADVNAHSTSHVLHKLTACCRHIIFEILTPKLPICRGTYHIAIHILLKHSVML